VIATLAYAVRTTLRSWADAQGRAHRIRKRSNHITIILDKK